MKYYRYRGDTVEIQGHQIARSTVYGTEAAYIIIPSVPVRFEATRDEIDMLIAESRPFNQNTDLIFGGVDLASPALPLKNAPSAKVLGRKAPRRTLAAPEIADPEAENTQPAPAQPAPIGRAGDSDPVPDQKDPDTVPNVPDTPENERALEAVLNPEPATAAAKREAARASDTGEKMPVDSSGVSSTEAEAPPLDLPDPEEPDAQRRAIFEDNKSKYGEFQGRAPIQYTSLEYWGGSVQDYKVVPLPPCGKGRIEFKPLSKRVMPINLSGIYEAPQAFQDDMQSNIIPALGFKIDLPFDRLHLCLSDVTSTCILTSTSKGIRQGTICVNPRQIQDIAGGFNSRTVAQAITHELAHFVDHTLLRNVARMKFNKSILGKQIHPLQSKMGAATTNAEHFATLAELMVWGSTHRMLYDLSGFDVVNTFFVNRYVTKTDLQKYGN